MSEILTFVEAYLAILGLTFIITLFVAFAIEQFRLKPSRRSSSCPARSRTGAIEALASLIARYAGAPCPTYRSRATR